jgi:dTDP-4-dehydrorhamnose reductase
MVTNLGANHPRALIVGAGFVARAVAAGISRCGYDVVVASRTTPSRPLASQWVRLDATNRPDCRRLCESVEPALVVLAHGPSSIEWCTENPLEALTVHAGVAANFADCSFRTILVSTDQVFPGVHDSYSEDDQVCPANAYGRAKIRAEELLARRSSSLIWRVSLVYGWHKRLERANFFEETVSRLSGGEAVLAPIDQWTTPVVFSDVGRWAELLTESSLEGCIHLGGPRRVSRFDWAREIAAGFGLADDLVRPCKRTETRYRDRSQNSCLHSTRVQELSGPFSSVQDPQQALATLRSNWSGSTHQEIHS